MELQIQYCIGRSKQVQLIDSISKWLVLVSLDSACRIKCFQINNGLTVLKENKTKKETFHSTCSFRHPSSTSETSWALYFAFWAIKHRLSASLAWWGRIQLESYPNEIWSYPHTMHSVQSSLPKRRFPLLPSDSITRGFFFF